jgi:hypothetical protein
MSGSGFQQGNNNIRHDLILNEFNDSIMKPVRSNRSASDTIYHGMVIPYVRGISAKFRHTGNRFNVRTIFKTKHTLRGTLMKTGTDKEAQEIWCVYSIPLDCGICYIGEKSRPSIICWKVAKVLQIEPNTTYRKYRNLPTCLW